MATMPQALNAEELKTLTTAAKVRAEYTKLALAYNRIIEGRSIKCPTCGEWLSEDTFYSDQNYATGKYPECKRCILAEVEQRTKKTDIPNERKESVQKVLMKMDLPYIDSFYMDCVKGAEDGMKEKNRKSPFATYITCIKSLPNWKGMTWHDSEFESDMSIAEEEQKLNQKMIKQGKKRFGKGYSDEEYMFLETEYTDWTKRYTCENKAQELLFKRICFKELDINKAQLAGKDTKELDKTLQELMASLSVKPSQSNSNALTEAKTFGQLIQLWENEKPIPEPEEEFKDVDKIGLYIDVFFKGHLSRMMGLKNAFSTLYDKFMAKYTVSKPQYDEDVDSEALFDQIFGSKVDDE